MISEIRVLLDSEPTITWTVKQIASHFKMAGLEDARRALSEAYRTGNAARVAYGLYRSIQDPDGYISSLHNEVPRKYRRKR